MRLLITLAILTGWLVTELKDFVNGGGVSNILAFGLLKICFILFSIIILIILISFYDFFVGLVGNIRQTNLPNLDRKKNEQRLTPLRRNSG